MPIEITTPIPPLYFAILISHKSIMKCVKSSQASPHQLAIGMPFCSVRSQWPMQRNHARVSKLNGNIGSSTIYAQTRASHCGQRTSNRFDIARIARACCFSSRTPRDAVSFPPLSSSFSCTGTDIPAGCLFAHTPIRSTGKLLLPWHKTLE